MKVLGLTPQSNNVVTYNPAKTQFLKKGEENGAVIETRGKDILSRAFRADL